MRLIFLLSNALVFCCLAACSTSPLTITEEALPEAIIEEAPKPVQPTATPAPVIELGEPSTEQSSGIGKIAHSEQRRENCTRKIRTGSRIRRDDCGTTGFNGIYPSGGINVGTGTERQGGYGPR